MTQLEIKFTEAQQLLHQAFGLIGDFICFSQDWTAKLAMEEELKRIDDELKKFALYQYGINAKRIKV